MQKEFELLKKLGAGGGSQIGLGSRVWGLGLIGLRGCGFRIRDIGFGGSVGA